MIGTSGSGKTTLAKQIARRRQVPHIELDAIHWLPGWQEEDDERYREKLKTAIAQPSWVLDGNYFSKSVDIQWNKVGGATAVVWCDYSFIRTCSRAINRAWTRAWTQQEIWPGTGNRESFRKSFFSLDSVVAWTIYSFRENRKRYSEIIQQGRYPHIRFVRLRNPRDCEAFLAQF